MFEPQSQFLLRVFRASEREDGPLISNRSRTKALTGDDKGGLNRRISNEEQQNVEGE